MENVIQSMYVEEVSFVGTYSPEGNVLGHMYMGHC